MKTITQLMKAPRLFKSKFTILLFSLVLLLLLSPYLYEFVILQWALSVLFLFVITAVIMASRASRSTMICLLLAGVISVLFDISHTVFNLSILDLLHEIFFGIFCMTTIILFTKEIMSSREKVNRDIIFGAICVYLLVGLFYAMVYSIVEILHPGSFVNLTPGVDPQLTSSDFYYFSFVTLTTLGYGDVAVITPYAKSVVILESITGIFYLATLVARLVVSQQDD